MITTIHIAITPTQKAPIEADVYGDWAVHRSRANGTRWSITQVSTGRCIKNALVEEVTKKQAIEVAKMLDRDFTKVKVSKRNGKIILEAILKLLKTLMVPRG